MSSSECIMKCVLEPTCESVNIHGDDVKALGKRVCELNSASKATDPTDYNAHIGIAYAGWWGEKPETILIVPIIFV